MAGRGRAWLGLSPAGLVAVLLVSALSWALVVALLTLHDTVQQPGYYERALADAGVYERLYTQVLTDPEVVDLTDQLLARLPVQRTVVTDNLRLVIPPAALRGVTDRLSEQVAGYLAGEEERLDLRVDLRPVFDNIARLVTVYIVGQLSGVPAVRADDVARFVADVLADLEDVAHGQPPASVPSLVLSADQADAVADVLVGKLDPSVRSRVRGQVVVLLRQGDLRGALALVGPLVFQGGHAAVADLRRRLSGGTYLDLSRPLPAAVHAPLVLGGRYLHVLGGAGVLALATLLVAVEVGVVGVGARRARRRGASARPLILAVCLTSGLTALLAAVALAVATAHPLAALTGATSSLPPGARALLQDVAGGLARPVLSDWLRLAALPLALAGLMVAGGFLVRAVAQWRAAPRPWVTAASLGGTVAAVSVAMWFVFPVTTTQSVSVCNGLHILCSRRYDQVTYAATHNAMASSDAGFLGAEQDPDLIGQLDHGVRALLVDVQHWTTAREVDKFLATLSAQQRALLEPFTRAARTARPGLWLCHNLCQLGALDLVSQLHRVRDWLDANPTEIVTLIVQDSAPGEEVMTAFGAAGLDPYLLTPPGEPEGSWPTLGGMIRDHRRLVVFAEHADVPGTWYRSFFRYASDTPFDVTAPDQFTCRENRGTADARMLLINHWVTRAAGSRYDATIVNRRSSLLSHVRQCERERHRNATFLAVNFAAIGDLVRTVSEINSAQV